MAINTSRAQVDDIIQSDKLTFGVRLAKDSGLDQPTLVGRKDDFCQPREEVPDVDPGRADRLYRVVEAEEKNMGQALSWPSSWVVVAEECNRDGTPILEGEKITFCQSGAVGNLVEEVTLVQEGQD